VPASFLAASFLAASGGAARVLVERKDGNVLLTSQQVIFDDLGR
jgi:hypothetical protein